MRADVPLGSNAGSAKWYGEIQVHEDGMAKIEKTGKFPRGYLPCSLFVSGCNALLPGAFLFTGVANANPWDQRCKRGPASEPLQAWTR